MKKYSLFLEAALAWIFAGLMVMNIGAKASIGSFHGITIYHLISFIIYLIFYLKVFAPQLKKNSRRIDQLLDGKVHFWSFLDKKGYGIMAFMIIFGILLRKSSLLAPKFIFVLYLGLGAALFSAGLRYFVVFIRERSQARAQANFL